MLPSNKPRRFEWIIWSGFKEKATSHANLLLLPPQASFARLPLLKKKKKENEKPFREEKELKARPQCRAGLGWAFPAREPGLAVPQGWDGEEGNSGGCLCSGTFYFLAFVAINHG